MGVDETIRVLKNENKYKTYRLLEGVLEGY